jgi:hypothetical protein
VSKLSIMFLMLLGRHRSMQGKSDPTLMQSMKQLQLHCERLREQKKTLLEPVMMQRTRSAANVFAGSGLEMVRASHSSAAAVDAPAAVAEDEAAPLLASAAPMRRV